MHEPSFQPLFLFLSPSPEPYLYRYTIRPRERSYGLNSIATRSPGRIRMKFFLIRPETCARTWCLFSSSTLNMALGSVSTTVAITSIASSFDSPYPFRQPPPGRPYILLRLQRQNLRAPGRNRHRMLEVRAQTSILRYRSPSVLQHLNVRAARVHHRLNRDHHAFAQLLALPAPSKVRNLRVLMQ